jgi:hypothetical protein
MKEKEKMKKLNHLQVSILKMEESSGNQQFYVRLDRTDEKTHGSNLDYNCFQTKYLDKKECLERAWFSASMLARFCGLSSMDEVILGNFTNEEIEMIKQSLYLKW